eukprot:TRINITY_DN2925_c1_g1_i1.p1 TRINITY_DN2925_c1_g1~~TRINITY_DN2925_c1_g1_i1.p1  ORF type:complete len:495 (-),score=148.37 TRINITY_DN2925_c1_g1_i1:184-1668(-)
MEEKEEHETTAPSSPSSDAPTPTLQRVRAPLPTGGFLFGLPSNKPEDVKPAWELYASSFRPDKDRELKGLPTGRDTQLRAAYEFMDAEVWPEMDMKKRLEKAVHVIENISADCAEAYQIRAELESTSIEEALLMYRAGMEAGERHLEKLEAKYLERNAHRGSLFERPEMQPFLRCKSHYAHCLRLLGRYEEAMMGYQEIIRLCNPLDNLGTKTCLLLTLLLMKKYDEGVQFVTFLYSQNSGGVVPSYLFWADTILTFHVRSSDTDPSSDTDASSVEKSMEKLRVDPEVDSVARLSVMQAVQMAPLVFPYLLGEKKLPSFVSPYIITGTELEATACARDFLPVVKSMPGMLEYLQTCRLQGAGTDPAFGKSLEDAKRAKDTGNEFFRKGGMQNWQIAIQQYTTALKFLPVEEKREQAILLSNQAACLFNMNMFDRCAVVADHAIHMDNTYPKSYLRLAQAFIQLKKFSDAKEVLKELLRVDPGNTVGEKMLADLP